MAESGDVSKSSSSPWSSLAVHTIYIENPPNNEQPEAHHIKTLASVLGTEEVAKEALIYTYRNIATGFSAKLTPEQVSDLSKKPGVLQVIPDRADKKRGYKIKGVD